MKIAWGAVVTPDFCKAVIATCKNLGIPDPSYLMACIAFETGETFSPAIKNSAGSGAVGLIQFMPSTAKALGTTTAALATMTGEDQLEFVWKYLRDYRGRLKTLGDVYGAILWPAMIGKPDDYVVFDRNNTKSPKLYSQNRGLDYNKDGKITKAEVVAKVQGKLTKGLQPPYVGKI